MKTGYTHLGILLDKSGSMWHTWDDTKGAVQSLLVEQAKQPGELTVSLLCFSDKASVNAKLSHDFTPGNDIKTLNLPSPGGNTALYDAFCRLVDETGAKLALMPESERPEKVITVVVTDGADNTSETRIESVRQKLEEQKNTYSWEFVFLGADFDAVGLGTSLGASAGACAVYNVGAEVDAYSHVSKSLSKFRSGVTKCVSLD